MSALDDALRSAEELTLETRGRRSGQPHRVTVWFAYDPPDLLLRTDTERDWFRNLSHDRRCRVTVGRLHAEAELVGVYDAPADLERAVELWRAKYGQEWVQPWYFERGRAVVRLRVLPA